MHQPNPAAPSQPRPPGARQPRRRARWRRLLVRVEAALAALEKLDRRAPLPAAFAAELAALGSVARRLPARYGATPSKPLPVSGPVAPGAALVALLVWRVAVGRALALPGPAKRKSPVSAGLTGLRRDGGRRAEA